MTATEDLLAGVQKIQQQKQNQDSAINAVIHGCIAGEAAPAKPGDQTSAALDNLMSAFRVKVARVKEADTEKVLASPVLDDDGACGAIVEYVPPEQTAQTSALAEQAKAVAPKRFDPIESYAFRLATTERVRVKAMAEGFFISPAFLQDIEELRLVNNALRNKKAKKTGEATDAAAAT